MIFIMPFLGVLFILWFEKYTTNVRNDFIFNYVFSIYIFALAPYIGCLGNFYSGIWQGGYKVLPNPFPRGMLSVRMTEKFIADFFCFAVLFPLAIQIILFLPYFILSIEDWILFAGIFFVTCSPLVALKFLRIAIVEDTSLRRYHDAVPFLGEAIEMITLMSPMIVLIYYIGQDDLPWSKLAMAATIITIILWWATYRIRLKNATR